MSHNNRPHTVNNASSGSSNSKPMQADLSKEHWAWQQRIQKEMFAGNARNKLVS